MELCGRFELYFLLQAAMTMRASSNVVKISASRHSRRNVPLKLSLLPFCQSVS
jgi:hypothetical protein